ncbi:hypothetical protein N825_25250 [Skermanella stibiiresistens SB22]|uniref:TNase-like domain-containing protein n=1 Tax=Skermanella stibiiresistens SB22 TaxID=1385369 RepID=W9GZ39_9PROT|nr:thermonuclease family protein [Skermanella stibiiresistens]EWY36743.1 hypothetical protein N825_25250 [Skermanella stibiiresistens SB22]
MADQLRRQLPSRAAGAVVAMAVLFAISPAQPVARPSRVTIASATVETVKDGDTITLRSAKGTLVTVRMSDYDSPEIGHGSARPGQRGGDAARDQLLSLLPIGAKVKATCYDVDVYDRLVCHIYRGRGRGRKNVNLEMLRSGWG